MGSTARRVAGKAATLVVAAVALLLAAAFVPTLFGYEALVVSSGSMGGAAPMGSVALTRMVDADAVGVGDVISWRNPGRTVPITHRVIEVAESDGRFAFRTKGDANAAPDPQPVIVAERVPRVERVVPLAGWIVRIARSPLGAFFLFAVPILGLILDRGPGRRGGGQRAAAERGSPAPGIEFPPGWQVAVLTKTGAGSSPMGVPWPAQGPGPRPGA